MSPEAKKVAWEETWPHMTLCFGIEVENPADIDVNTLDQQYLAGFIKKFNKNPLPDAKITGVGAFDNPNCYIVKLDIDCPELVEMFWHLVNNTKNKQIKPNECHLHVTIARFSAEHRELGKQLLDTLVNNEHKLVGNKLVGKTIETGAICINYKNGFRILMN
jgi:2'-5' RNA ligase